MIGSLTAIALFAAVMLVVVIAAMERAPDREDVAQSSDSPFEGAVMPPGGPSDPSQPMFSYTPEQLLHRVSWGIWSDVAYIVAGVFAVLVIRDIDRRQRERRARVQGWHGQPASGA